MVTVKRAGRGLSPHTVRAYRADVATFAAHLVGVSPTDRGVASRVALSQLSPAKVTAALSAIQASGAADKTRARLHGTLTGLFAYLIQQRLLEQDPLVAPVWTGPRSVNDSPATWTSPRSSRRSLRRRPPRIRRRGIPGSSGIWRWPGCWPAPPPVPEKCARSP